MRSLKLLFISTLFIMAGTVLSAQELSKSSVQEMVDKMSKAASDRDVGLIEHAIHDQASITLNVTISGKTQVMSVSKAQYIQLLKQGLQAATRYEHEVSNLQIIIQGAKAFVSTDVKETIEINGQSQVGNSRENLTIEDIDGKLKITGIVAFTTL